MRLGVHVSSAGKLSEAVGRAHGLGCKMILETPKDTPEADPGNLEQIRKLAGVSNAGPKVRL